MKVSRIGWDSTQVGDLSRLKSLAVETNALEALPGTLGALPLTSLLLHENRIVTLPRGLTGCVRLEVLGLHKNRLSELPDLAALEALRSLLVDTNALAAVGALPAALDVLILNANALEALPRFAGGLRSLAANENVISAIPDLGGVPSLTTLSLSANRIRRIPDVLPFGLRTLNLERASGVFLPFDLPRARGRRFADRYNEIQAVPPSIGDLADLRLLKLSYNRLTAVPGDVSRLAELRGLFLLGNPGLGGVPAGVRARLCWVDDSCDASRLDCSVVRGRCDRALPFANFHVRRGYRACVLAFAIGGIGEWGLVLENLAVDVAYVYDLERSSYTARTDAVDRYAEDLAGSYETLSILGSSQGAYGALLNARHGTGAVVAFSPRRSEMRGDDGLSDADVDRFRRGRASERPVKVIVGSRNAGDLAIAARIREALPRMEILSVDSPEHGAAGLFPDRAGLVDLVHALLLPPG